MSVLPFSSARVTITVASPAPPAGPGATLPSRPHSGRRTMEWEGREESDDLEDRRGISGKAAIGGGAGIIVVILALVFGVDPQKFIGQGGGGGEGPPHKPSPEEERMAKFSRVIFRDTEVV